MSVEFKSKEMTLEEVERIKKMNWEWYYNYFLHKDTPVEIACGACGKITIFLPGEKTKNCQHCGVRNKRCEVYEDEGEGTRNAA